MGNLGKVGMFTKLLDEILEILDLLDSNDCHINENITQQYHYSMKLELQEKVIAKWT